MKLVKFQVLMVLSLFASVSCRTTSVTSESELNRIHTNVDVGEYSADRSIHINKCATTFLGLMKKDIFPTMIREAGKPQKSKLEGVNAGHGVEVRFANDVTTYHVDFPASDRGGRSYGAVGTNPKKMAYVADVSYSDYFKQLEKAYWADKAGLMKFYQAILGTLMNCDASMVPNLSDDYKKSYSDFMAVFIAEQFRNLVSNSRDITKPFSKTSDWDNAHLQTTLIAAFHSGQTKQFNGMFWWGKFTDKTYDTFNDCPIYVTKDPQGKAPRSFRLSHYTQANKTCDRSGVNMTRRDWEKLTDEISVAIKDSKAAKDLKTEFGGRNGIEEIANWVTTNSNDSTIAGDARLKAAVAYLQTVQDEALELTKALLDRDK